MGEPPGPLSKMPLAHVTEGKIGVGPEGGMSVGGRRGGRRLWVLGTGKGSSGSVIDSLPPAALLMGDTVYPLQPPGPRWAWPSWFLGRG